jgi:DNA mismatch endonuclease (patch repair protein)
MHRRAFWVNKLEGNAARDKVNQRALRELGRKTVIVWECDVDRPKSLDRLTRKLEKLLKPVHHDFRDL